MTRLFHGTSKDAARAPRALHPKHPHLCLASQAPPPLLRADPVTLTLLTRAILAAPLPGAILTDGFRLPAHAGMFGRGIYFADTPLKSLQYTGGKLGGCVGGGRRYMLVCDVELGNQLETTSAKSSLEPETDLRRSGVPALLGQRSFDSVAAKPSLFGLRAPEFVVYKPAQVRPRYLLAVEQVPKDSADALGIVAEKRALKARARVRAAAAASALHALEEGVVKAEAEAEAVAATPQADASSSSSAAEVAAEAAAAVAAAASAAADEDAAMRELLGGLWLERSGRFFWKRRWHAVDAERAALVHFTHDVSAVPLPPLFRGALPLEAIRSIEASGDDCLMLQLYVPKLQPHAPRLQPYAATRPGYSPMPPGDDCLTLQLHGDLGAVTLRVPPGHAGVAVASSRGALQAWAARSKQSETELLVDLATVRARRDALAAVLRRLRARLPRRLQRNAEAADWRPAAAILSDSLRTRTFRPSDCDAEANFARRPSLSAAEVPPATLRVQAATLCAGGCNHTS